MITAPLAAVEQDTIARPIAQPIAQSMRYGNGPMDAFDADENETILGHLIYERGILIDHALQALRPMLVAKLRSTKASATWSIRLGGAGVVGGVLLGAVVGPAGILPALAGAALVGMGAQARSHLPRREAEAAIVLRHPQVLDEIKALALQGVSPLQLVAAWDELLDHIVDLGPEGYRGLGTELIGAEFGRLAQSKSAPMLRQGQQRSQRPIAAIQIAADQEFDDEELEDYDPDDPDGVDDPERDNWEYDDYEYDDDDEDSDRPDFADGDLDIEPADEPEPEDEPEDDTADLWDDDPDDDLTLWAKLDHECPQLLRLINCGPLRIIGPTGSGKSELVTALLSLRWKYAHHLVERPLSFGAELDPIEAWIAAGAECATRVRRAPAKRTTYVWDQFIDLDSFAVGADTQSLKTAFSMILRHSQAIDTYHIFVALTDDQCHNPIAGTAQLFRRSSVKVEAIAASVQGADGLYQTVPSREYRVTWIDGVVEKFVLPEF